MAFIDTSILVTYFCNESSSPLVQQELNRISQRMISPLIGLEFSSALAIKIRTREISLGLARDILVEYQQQLKHGVFTVQTISDDAYAQAFNWLSRFETNLQAADALHLALAFEHRTMLLTRDIQQASAAQHFDVKVKHLP